MPIVEWASDGRWQALDITPILVKFYVCAQDSFVPIRITSLYVIVSCVEHGSAHEGRVIQVEAFKSRSRL